MVESLHFISISWAINKRNEHKINFVLYTSNGRLSVFQYQSSLTCSVCNKQKPPVIYLVNDIINITEKIPPDLHVPLCIQEAQLVHCNDICHLHDTQAGCQVFPF